MLQNQNIKREVVKKINIEAKPVTSSRETRTETTIPPPVEEEEKIIE